MKQKYKNYLGWTIKISVAILTIHFLYSKLNNDESLRELDNIIGKLNTTPVVLVFISLLALMALNWLCEVYKWQLMMVKVQPISFWAAFQTVVCGISLGTITPGRVGDFATRIMMIPPYKRVLGVIVLSMGAFAQFVMYNVLASVAIPIFIYFYMPEHITWVYVMMFASPIYSILLLMLYFNIGSFDKLINKVGFLRRYKRFFTVLSTYDRPFLIRIMIISLIRFFILVVQYYLLINLLIPSITFAQVTLMITLLFTIQSIVPTIDILNIGLRGVTAVYLFGFITDQYTTIVIITTIIWLINLIIPSLIGLSLIMRLPQNRNANWLKMRD